MPQPAESVRRFMVKRTSVWDEEKQPCPEAYRATYTHVDQRTAKNHEAMTKIDGAWMHYGENHRYVRGIGVARDFPGREAWFIDMPDLDALMAFIERHGEVVIGPAWENHGITRIEIYDGYRE